MGHLKRELFYDNLIDSASSYALSWINSRAIEVKYISQSENDEEATVIVWYEETEELKK